MNTGGHVQMRGVMRRGTRVIWRKLVLPESQSPVMQVLIHRKQHLKPVPRSVAGLSRCPVQPPGRGAMPSEGIQGDEWDA